MIRDSFELIRNNAIFSRFPTTKQMVKFVFVGSAVTALDFTIYIALTRGFLWWEKHFLLANAVSFIVAVSVSFFGNKTWTFRDREGLYIEQYPKFFAVNLVGITVNQSVLFALTSYLSFYDLFAKIAATAIVVCWNFSMYKFWIFKR